MNNINEIAKNIKKIEEFSRYLKNNYKTHSAIVKKLDSNLDDIDNSIACLKDYKEVSDELMEVINDYCKTTGMEF